MPATKERVRRANGRPEAPTFPEVAPAPQAEGPEHADGHLRVRRFDADRQDREISLEQALKSSPNRRQLLWIDIVGDNDARVLAAIAKRFDFDPETRRVLEQPVDRPQLTIHGSYFHLSAAAAPGTPSEQPTTWLHVVASETVVITRHGAPIELLDEIDARIKSDTTLGAAVGAEFVATLLDAVVTSYFTAVDEIDDAIDDLDARSLRDDERHELLEDLVRLRRRIARLRRVLTTHRTLFAALSGPDMRQLVGQEPAGDLQDVAARFEAAVASVEGSRTSLLGSFDVYMTRTAQRTNEVMKILTIATVLLLPGSVIAGLLGMNVVVPLNKDDPMSFWLVIGSFVLLVGVALAVAKMKRWI